MTRNKSAHVPYRCEFFLHIFNLWLVESKDAEPKDRKGQLCVICINLSNTSGNLDTDVTHIYGQKDIHLSSLQNRVI